MNIQAHYRRRAARDEADRFIADVFARGTHEANRWVDRSGAILGLLAAAAVLAWVLKTAGFFG